MFIVQPLPEILPILVVVILGGQIDVLEPLDFWRGCRVVAFEVADASAEARGHEAPVGIAQNVGAELRQFRVVGLELRARVPS